MDTISFTSDKLSYSAEDSLVFKNNPEKFNFNPFVSQLKPVENDPIHQLFVKKHETSVNNSIDNSYSEQYNCVDIAELEEFCLKYGIIGVNFGNMNPKQTLNMLKRKMGIKEEHIVKKELLKG